MADEIKQTTPPASNPAPVPAPAPAARNFSRQNDGFRPIRKGFGGGRRGESNDGFETKMLDLARVTRVTGGGKRMSAFSISEEMARAEKHALLHPRRRIPLWLWQAAVVALALCVVLR